MKRSVSLVIAFLLVSVQLFAKTPVYLTKAYKPVDSKFYNAYSSLEIQGGDTWNNCFVLGVINNLRGKHDPEVKSRMLFSDLNPYKISGSSFNLQSGGRQTWVTPETKPNSTKIGDKTYDYGLILGIKSTRK